MKRWWDANPCPHSKSRKKKQDRGSVGHADEFKWVFP